LKITSLVTFFSILVVLTTFGQAPSPVVAISAIERRGALPQFLAERDGKLYSFAHLGDSALENKALRLRIKLPAGFRSDNFEGIVKPQFNAFGFRVAQFQFIRIVYFDYNSVLIRNDASAELDKLAGLIMTYSLGQVTVTVHTDSRGTSQYNKQLAARRGDAIKKYLMHAGVDEKLLAIKVSGEEELVKDCLNEKDCDEQTHQMNRRAEFSFNPMLKK
jgi:outer membrane protein OmpA-like peptidoglycan-associated protein